MITAAGLLRKITIAGDQGAIAAAIGCERSTHVRLHHGLALWFDHHHSDPGRRPNMAAVCLMSNCSHLDVNTMPIPNDTVVLTGIDSAAGTPAALHTGHYRALAAELMANDTA